MKATGIFFGSSTGTTEDVAGRIAEKLGIDASDIHNVADASVDDVAPYEALILGTSTWGSGDLQDDWDAFIGDLKGADLSGKTVALFGLGDSSSFCDTYCDGMGTLYNELQGTGCKFVGAVSTEGYTFDSSIAVVDDKFVGLALDEMNEDDQTDARIDQWVAAIEGELA